MAERYWVGGTAAWDNTAGTKWASVSGGAGGASVPFTGDNVYFDSASGSVTVTVSATVYATNLNFTGFTGTFAGTSTIVIAGNIILGSSMTRTYTGVIQLTSAVTTNTITSNGITLGSDLYVNGGGKWSLQDALSNPTKYLVLTSGTFDGNNQNVTFFGLALTAGTKTLTLGNGTWTVTGNGSAWNANTNVANLTVSPSSGVISMTSASAKTFAGGAKTWPTLNQGGSGALTIEQSNSFANIINSVQPATITLTAGTTQTVAAFGVSGTAGNLITLNSRTAGTRATLSDSTGTVEVSYVSIKDISATGGANWNAFLKSGNVDAGNNLGWDFFPAVRQVFSQVFTSIFRPIF